MNNKCLVTGATGDLGRILIPKLISHNYDVYAFVRKTSKILGLKNTGCKFLTGDLKDSLSLKKSLKNINYVFHIGEIAISDNYFYEGNLNAIETIISEVKNNPSFKKLIFVSSICVQCFSSSKIIDENSEISEKMNCLHTSYKRLSEERLLLSNIPVNILRAPFIYGPSIKYIQSFIKFINFFWLTGCPFLGKGDKLMPFFHADDFVNVMINSMNDNIRTPEIYNLVDDKPTTFKEFIYLIQNNLKIKNKLIPIPHFIVYFFAKCFDYFNFKSKYPNASDWIKFFCQDLNISNNKMKENLLNKLQYPTIHEGTKTLFKE